jgi:hypothetical protein
VRCDDVEEWREGVTEYGDEEDWMRMVMWMRMRMRMRMFYKVRRIDFSSRIKKKERQR